MPSEGLFFYTDVKKKRKLLAKPISVKTRHGKRKELHDKSEVERIRGGFYECPSERAELQLLAACEGEPESVEHC